MTEGLWLPEISERLVSAPANEPNKGGYRYCPRCGAGLGKDAEGLSACGNCSFIHYDNPTPVVACIIPQDEGVVLVKRGVEPFAGEWCLPCGYVNKYEHPKAACAREVKEETGLGIRVEKLLSVCNPGTEDNPLNNLVIHYLGRRVGGELQAGDDAQAVEVFSREKIPEICFRSHRESVNKWYAGRYGEITGVDL